jgi:hypothetical protein
MLLELNVEIFFNIPEALIEFLCGIDVLFKFHPSVINFDEFMNAHQ